MTLNQIKIVSSKFGISEDEFIDMFNNGEIYVFTTEGHMKFYCELELEEKNFIEWLACEFMNRQIVEMNNTFFLIA